MHVLRATLRMCKKYHNLVCLTKIVFESGGSNGGLGVHLTPPPPVFKYPMKMNNFVSVRPYYFIFMGYLKGNSHHIINEL